MQIRRVHMYTTGRVIFSLTCVLRFSIRSRRSEVMHGYLITTGFSGIDFPRDVLGLGYP